MAMWSRVVAVALLLATGTTWLLARSYSSPELGRAALESAREATHLSLEAETFRFRPLGGLELADVRAASSFPGGSYDVELRSVKLEHRLAPLLGGRLEIDRVVVVEPRMILTLGREDEPPYPPAENRTPARSRTVDPPDPGADDDGSSSPRLGFALSEIRIDRGSFTIRDRSQDPARLSVHGFSLALDNPRIDPTALTILHGIEGAGSLAIEKIGFARTEVTALSGKLHADDAHLGLAELGFALPRGDFHGEMELDFNSIPFRYTMSLSGDCVFPDAWAAPVGLQLDAAGFGTSPRALSGEGTLELPSGRLPGASWVRALEEHLDVEIVGIEHRGARGRFRVDAGKVIVEELRLQAPPYAIDVEGFAELDGPLHLRLGVATTGSRARKFRLAGTLAAPELEEVE